MATVPFVSFCEHSFLEAGKSSRRIKKGASVLDTKVVEEKTKCIEIAVFVDVC